MLNAAVRNDERVMARLGVSQGLLCLTTSQGQIAPSGGQGAGFQMAPHHLAVLADPHPVRRSLLSCQPEEAKFAAALLSRHSPCLSTVTGSGARFPRRFTRRSLLRSVLACQ